MIRLISKCLVVVIGLFCLRQLTVPVMANGANDKAEDATTNPLRLATVLRAVTSQYPPYLAALIERDIASGRLRAASGVFDFETFAKITSNPSGFYEATTINAGFEQYMGFRGGTFFGGYKRTTGALPDYYSERRTNGGGEPYVGIRLPLLQDGSIDKERASLIKARLERELAEPMIRQQMLMWSETAMRTYFAWIGAGARLEISEELLRIAIERDSAIATQIEKGLAPSAQAVENRQLIVSRELSVIKARREFETVGVTLSLFLRGENDEPLLPTRKQLPPDFPTVTEQNIDMRKAIEIAVQSRPEIEEYALKLEKLNVDKRLFKNQLLPKFDAVAQTSQGIGEQLYKDKGDFEFKLGLEFRMPLQRRAAKGAIEENQAQIDQLAQEAVFAADKIAAETRAAILAVQAFTYQIGRAIENAKLAVWLLDAESERFKLGASDLLALQIRERAVFEAKKGEAEAKEKYFSSISRLMAAIGADFSIVNSAADFSKILVETESR